MSKKNKQNIITQDISLEPLFLLAPPKQDPSSAFLVPKTKDFSKIETKEIRFFENKKNNVIFLAKEKKDFVCKKQTLIFIDTENVGKKWIKLYEKNIKNMEFFEKTHFYIFLTDNSTKSVETNIKEISNLFPEKNKYLFWNSLTRIKVPAGRDSLDFNLMSLVISMLSSYESSFLQKVKIEIVSKDHFANFLVSLGESLNVKIKKRIL